MRLVRKRRDAAGLVPAASQNLAICWGGYASATILFALALAVLSKDFGPAVEMAERPVLALVGVLIFAGTGFAVLLPTLIRRSERVPEADTGMLFLIVVGSGVIARLVLFASEPMLENDFQRYLWDGGVTARGHNPYALSPLQVIQDGPGGVLGDLASEARDPLSKIGHKSLTTIYPPVAQGAFAVAHLITPWSLNAWRGVLLACDVATLLLLITLLDATARSRLWAALYWLNPVVLKEAFNSAHMEPVLLPLVLLSVYLGWNKRHALGTIALAFATAVKLWPILLLPVLWRPLLFEYRNLAFLSVVFGLLTALWLFPMLMSAPIETSGLAAYAESWKTNSALYPMLEESVAAVLLSIGASVVDAAVVCRALIATVLVGIAVHLARRPWSSLGDLLQRIGTIIAVLVLLSPAQYPWYTLWYAPFLAFLPSRAFLVLSATIPLYYSSFYFAALDVPEVFTSTVVWVIWLPVWLVAVFEIVTSRRPRPLVLQSG